MIEQERWQSSTWTNCGIVTLTHWSYCSPALSHRYLLLRLSWTTWRVVCVVCRWSCPRGFVVTLIRLMRTSGRSPAVCCSISPSPLYQMQPTSITLKGSISTLNMLNCFKDDKRCIHIWYHILDFVQQKKIKFTMEQPYMLPMMGARASAGMVLTK